MLVINNKNSLIKIISSWWGSRLSIGFVPTMGALHEGHLSLIKKARQENDKVICSIFINPTQFNDKKDLINYPKKTSYDIELLKENNCDLVFIPSTKEMYPNKINGKTYDKDIGEIIKKMEGQNRPGHFNGVCTIVEKLFLLVKPTNAYFGQKDYQQLAVIKKLNQSKNLGVNIISCPTVREKNGLAMSSRNILLNQEERKISAEIYKTLLLAKKVYKKVSVNELKNELSKKLSSVDGLKLEYLEVVDMITLSDKIDHKNGSAIVCIAVFVGNVRLIDNMILN